MGDIARVIFVDTYINGRLGNNHSNYTDHPVPPLNGTYAPKGMVRII